MNIGEEYGGGIVFFVDEAGHALVAAKKDVGCHSSGCEEGRFEWADAVAVCRDFVSNGYRDWFLPNKDQLNQLYLKKDVVGCFADYSTGYWSSSESTATNAWLQLFMSGFQSHGHKKYLNRIRAIRVYSVA